MMTHQRATYTNISRHAKPLLLRLCESCERKGEQQCNQRLSNIARDPTVGCSHIGSMALRRSSETAADLPKQSLHHCRCSTCDLVASEPMWTYFKEITRTVRSGQRGVHHLSSVAHSLPRRAAAICAIISCNRKLQPTPPTMRTSL